MAGESFLSWFKPSFKKQTIALIAGQGQFPLLFVKAALSLNHQVVVIGFKGLTDTALEDLVGEVHYVDLGELGKIAELIRSRRIRAVALAGGVPKKELYNPNFKIDEAASGVIRSTHNRGDDHLLRALKVFLKVKCGASVIDSSRILKKMMATRGVLTHRAPTLEERADLRFGWRIAKGIGKLDVGQTVVVKNRVVLAVEAIEGTDNAIKRGADLGHGGAVIVKVCKPNQSRRFDLPCVGLDTLEMLKNANCHVLGVEAGKTVMINKDNLIETADRYHLTIVGI